MARSSIYPPSVQPGKPHLGEAPPGWKTYRFADLFEVVERPATLRDDEEYQLITAKRSRGGVVARERLLGKDILTKTQFYVAEDDFVISNRQIVHGGCGIVPAALDGAIVSNEYTVLRPKPVLLLDYLRYLPHTVYFQQTCFHASVGVDVEKMVFDAKAWLRNLINVPSLDLQAKISEALLAFDLASEIDLSHLDTLLRIKATMQKNTFSNGMDSSSRRFRLGDVATMYAGGTPSRSKDEFFGGNIPWVKSGEVNNPEIHETEECLTEAGFLNSSARWVPSGAILIAMYGATAGKVARLRIKSTTNQAVCAVIPNEGILPDYVFHALQALSADLIRNCQGSGQPNLSKTLIESAQVSIPSFDEQERIAAIFSGIDLASDSQRRKISQQMCVRSGVISKLMVPCEGRSL